jgi:ankyrin repeat protein
MITARLIERASGPRHLMPRVAGTLLRALLEYGRDPYLANADGLRSMYFALLLDKDDILAALLDHGVRPDAFDRDGNLP